MTGFMLGFNVSTSRIRGGRPRQVAVAVKVHADDQDQVNEDVVFCTAKMRREM
jgi:hypothetical protein